MPAVGESFLHINDFSGGLNLKDSPHYLQQNEAAECRNLVFERTGEALVRNGYIRYGDTGTDSPILGMHRFYSPIHRQLLVTSGTDIFLGDDSTGMFTSVRSDLQPEHRMGAVTWDWKHRAFFSNGIDPLMVWDGATMTNVSGNPPKGRFLVVHGNRLFVAGDSDYPTTLRWSGLGDYEDWPETNYAEADGPITGIVGGYGQLFIFTPDRIQVFIGDGGLTTTLGIQTLLDGVGCVAPDTIVPWDGKIIFLAHDGVRIFDGSQSVLLSSKIDPVVRNQTKDQRRDAVAEIYKGRYWLSWRGPGEKHNRSVYVLDLERGWWTQFHPMEATSLLTLSGTDDNGELLSGDMNGRVWWQDVGELDGDKTVLGIWRSKVFTPSPGWVFQYRNMSLEMHRMRGPLMLDWTTRLGMKSGTFRFEVPVYGDLWGRSLWGHAKWARRRPTIHRASFPRGAVGPTIQFGFRQHGPGSWSNFTVQMWPKRRAR